MPLAVILVQARHGSFLPSFLRKAGLACLAVSGSLARPRHIVRRMDGDPTYGARCAAVYDELFGGFDPASVDLLAELAGAGPALELGIGTGLVALPLAARGVPVHG